MFRHSSLMMLTAIFTISTLTSTATPSATHTISVGGGGMFMYEPDTVYANVGDIVVFEFYPTNHSVVRGEYAQSTACGNSGCNPCVPFELIHPDQEGFHSNNVLTQNSTGSDRTFNITVVDTSPIWFYCTALQSCHPNGMVGVINPANGTFVDQQKQAAISAPFQLLPGETWPAEGSGTASGESPASTPPSTNLAEMKRHVSGGAIAGIIIAVLILLGIAAVLFNFIIKRLRAKKQVAKNTVAVAEHESTEPPRAVNVETPVADLVSRSELWSTMSPVGMNQYMAITEKHLLSPPSGHPAFGQYSKQSTAYELEGDMNLARSS